MPSSWHLFAFFDVAGTVTGARKSEVRSLGASETSNREPLAHVGRFHRRTKIKSSNLVGSRHVYAAGNHLRAQDTPTLRTRARANKVRRSEPPTEESDR